MISRRVVVIVAAATAVGMSAAGASALVDNLNRASPDPLSKVSNNGRSVALPLEAKEFLSESQKRMRGLGDEVLLMATRGERNFFHIEGTSEISCYAAGATEGAQRFGSITCSNDFPASERPLLDMSLLEASQSVEKLHFVRLEGVAADGVAEVGVTDSEGTILAKTPVINNVYRLESVPVAARRLIGLDPAGTIVYELP